MANHVVTRFFGGPPLLVLSRLVLSSIVIGVILSVVGLDPWAILHSIEKLIREVWDVGFDAVRWLWRYFLLGAALVVPIWLLVRLTRGAFSKSQPPHNNPNNSFRSSGEQQQRQSGQQRQRQASGGQQQQQPPPPDPMNNISDAISYFGLDPHNYTYEDLRAAYKKKVEALHPDKWGIELPGHIRKQLDDEMKVLNAVRDLLKKEKGWK